MKRRRILLFAGLLAAASVVALAYLDRTPRQPVYEGRSITQWVDDASAESLTNRGFPVLLMDGSNRKVRQFGPAAVPTLVAMLEGRSDNPWKKKLRDYIIAHHSQRKWAANFVKQDAVIKLRPQTAVQFLRYMGADAELAVPALMHAANSPDINLAANALNALGIIHQRPETVVPFLTNVAGARGPVSLGALGALAGYTQCPDLVLPVLIKALSNDSLAPSLAFSMGNFGTNAVAAVPVLRRQTTNAQVFLQYYAARALQQIAPGSNDDVILPVYIRVLQDRSGQFSWDAIQAVYEMGPRARPAVPALLEVVSRGFPTSYGAPYALRAIDPEAAAKIWPEEMKRWDETYGRSPNPDAIVTREQFTVRIMSEKGPTLPRLLALLKNKERTYPANRDRDYAAWLIGEMGAQATAAVPALLDARLSSPSARAALMKIHGESPLPLFRQLNDTSDWQDWSDTATMIGDFGTNAEPAIPAILSALELPSSSLFRTPAASALGEIHRRPELCVPALIPLLGDPNVLTRRNALEALAKFGPDAKPAVPNIIESLEDLDYYARVSATNALKLIDPEAAAKTGIK
jgi:HEAT repeat protein